MSKIGQGTETTQGILVEKPFPAYKGDDPYIFVCYAHADDEIVYPEIAELSAQGINVWYDEGISAGRVWRAAIGDAIKNASAVLFYISPASLNSDHCSREINFALDERIDIVPSYLEKTQLTTDLQIGLGRVQALHRYNDKRYLDHLLAALKFSMGRKGPGLIPLPSRKKSQYLTILIALAVLTGIAAFYLTATRTTPTEGPVAMVIEPFDADMQRDMGLEYEIERRLSASPGLQVRVSDSVGERADYVFSGSIVGGQLTSQLVNGKGESMATWNISLQDSLSNAASLLTKELLTRMGRDTEFLSRFELEIPQQTFRDYLRASTLIRSSHSGEALKLAETKFQQVIEVAPRYAPAHAGLCNTYLFVYLESASKASFELAEKHCHRALTLDSLDMNVHVALGMLYRESGQSSKSIDSYNQALKLAPYSGDAMRGLAKTLAQTGANAQAERWLQEAIMVEPNHWENYHVLGIQQLVRAEFEIALETLLRAFALAPEEMSILNNIAIVHYMMGNYDQAIANWRQVAEIQPGAQIYANLGTSYFFQREFNSALEMYIEADKYAPDNHLYQGHIGEVLYVSSSGDYKLFFEQAVRLALEQLDINPHDQFILGSLAAYYAGLGDNENAYHFIERTLSAGALDLVATYKVAVSYVRIGEIEPAKETLENLINLGYERKLIERDANFDGLQSGQSEESE